MKIVISPRAEKQLRKLPKVSQIIIAKKIRLLSSTEVEFADPLRGYRNIARVRVGDFRIIYRKTKETVYIVLIGHRKDIYAKLRNLLG